MGKLETDTDSQDLQFEEIGLDPLQTNNNTNGANVISIEGSDTKSRSYSDGGHMHLPSDEPKRGTPNRV